MIRALSPDDAETLADIHEICFDDQWRWSAKGFFDTLSQSTSYGFAKIAKIDQNQDDDQDGSDDFIQGFILFSMVLDQIEILTFCVLPKFRNCGIGKALMDEMFLFSKKHQKIARKDQVVKEHEAAREHEIVSIFLEVSADNAPAIALYEKVGFRKNSESEKKNEKNRIRYSLLLIS